MLQSRYLNGQRIALLYPGRAVTLLFAFCYYNNYNPAASYQAVLSLLVNLPVIIFHWPIVVKYRVIISQKVNLSPISSVYVDLFAQ